MEIRKFTKHEPKYPAADIAKKLGAAAAAAALIAGCLTGCQPAEETSQLSGDVPYYAPEDELNFVGDMVEYSPDDELELEGVIPVSEGDVYCDPAEDDSCVPDAE